MKSKCKDPCKWRGEDNMVLSRTNCFKAMSDKIPGLLDKGEHILTLVSFSSLSYMRTDHISLSKPGKYGLNQGPTDDIYSLEPFHPGRPLSGVKMERPTIKFQSMEPSWGGMSAAGRNREIDSCVNPHVTTPCLGATARSRSSPWGSLPSRSSLGGTLHNRSSLGSQLILTPLI